MLIKTGQKSSAVLKEAGEMFACDNITLSNNGFIASVSIYVNDSYHDLSTTVTYFANNISSSKFIILLNQGITLVASNPFIQQYVTTTRITTTSSSLTTSTTTTTTKPATTTTIVKGNMYQT